MVNFVWLWIRVVFVLFKGLFIRLVVLIGLI